MAGHHRNKDGFVSSGGDRTGVILFQPRVLPLCLVSSCVCPSQPIDLPSRIDHGATTKDQSYMKKCTSICLLACFRAVLWWLNQLEKGPSRIFGLGVVADSVPAYCALQNETFSDVLTQFMLAITYTAVFYLHL